MSDNNNSLFKGLVFVTSIGKSSVPSYQLADLIKSKSGSTSFTLHPQVNYVLTHAISSIPKQKLDQINQLCITILNDSYVSECVKSNKLLDISPFQLNKLTNSNVSISSQISADSTNNNNSKVDDEYQIIPDIFHVSGITIYNQKDKQPNFTKEFNILTSHLLQYTLLANNNNVNKFFYLELQFDKDPSNSKPFRIYTQFGRTDQMNQASHQYRYFETKEESMNIYSSIYNVKTSEENGYRLVNVVESNIGSERKLALASKKDTIVTHLDEDVENNTQRTYISREVAGLIERIYSVATKSLSNYSIEITKQGLSTALGVISLQQLKLGQAILESIGKLLIKNNGKITYDNNDFMDLQELCSSYYSIVPRKIGNKAVDKINAIMSTYEKFDEQEDMLMLMMDLAKVGSQNSKDLVSSSISDMRYQALNCNIYHLHPDSSEYNVIVRSLIHLTPKQESTIKVDNIYRVSRPIEEKAFNNPEVQSIGNEKMLFHGTKSSNLLSVLSRGLQLPDVVLKRGFSERTDKGFLGAGIYFSKTIEDSLKYTAPYAGGNSKRAIFISTVALGNVSQHSKIDTSMRGPPQGYNSCHGLPKSSSNPNSPFTSDEYVIYSMSQQKLSYMIEFTMTGKDYQ